MLAWLFFFAITEVYSYMHLTSLTCDNHYLRLISVIVWRAEMAGRDLSDEQEALLQRFDPNRAAANVGNPVDSDAIGFFIAKFSKSTQTPEQGHAEMVTDDATDSGYEIICEQFRNETKTKPARCIYGEAILHAAVNKLQKSIVLHQVSVNLKKIVN